MSDLISVGVGRGVDNPETGRSRVPRIGPPYRPETALGPPSETSPRGHSGRLPCTGNVGVGTPDLWGKRLKRLAIPA